MAVGIDAGRRRTEGIMSSQAGRGAIGTPPELPRNEDTAVSVRNAGPRGDA